MQIFPESLDIMNQEELVYRHGLTDLRSISDFKEILVDSQNENVYVSAKYENSICEF